MAHIIQIDDEIRQAEAEETQLIEQIQADSDTRQTRFENALRVKESMAGKLAALGLTEAEIKALVGR